ncbi:hypothetical protein Scep_007943 [Stephania cephalantha]|uniref:Uncharacterized protein n=1 Tax=Stephania cephalantha TaxID=152367 RepID=A0AAP0PQI3_9MAGN
MRAAQIFRKTLNKYVFDVPRVSLRTNLEDTFDLKNKKREIFIRERGEEREKRKGKREKWRE